MLNSRGVIHRLSIALSDYRLRCALASGEYRRIKTGWYATPTADQDAIRARIVGGTLTGPSLLRLFDVWVERDDRLHVRVDPNTPRVRTTPDACIHYLPPPVDDRDDVLTALQAMANCAPLDHLVVAIDALFELGLVQRDEIHTWASRHWRLRLALERASEGSQSRGETRLRCFLQSHRIRFRIQVVIEEVGRVDIVIGDRLVIEVDGRAHHLGEQFERDRERDRELLRRGYLVLRLSYRMLYADWERTQATILQLIRRGDQHWTSRSRPDFSAV